MLLTFTVPFIGSEAKKGRLIHELVNEVVVVVVPGVVVVILVVVVVVKVVVLVLVVVVVVLVLVVVVLTSWRSGDHTFSTNPLSVPTIVFQPK